MGNNQEREDLSKIRHFKGSVKDFKNYWDEMAGVETNAFGTPEYQGFNDVHPTRGANDSEHWKTSNVDESKKSDALAKSIDKAMIKIDDSMSYSDFALAVGTILRDEYGQHNFGPFMKVLHKDLGI
jgi:hypothetical protein